MLSNSQHINRNMSGAIDMHGDSFKACNRLDMQIVQYTIAIH